MKKELVYGLVLLVSCNWVCLQAVTGRRGRGIECLFAEMLPCNGEGGSCQWGVGPVVAGGEGRRVSCADMECYATPVVLRAAKGAVLEVQLWFCNRQKNYNRAGRQ